MCPASVNGPKYRGFQGSLYAAQMIKDRACPVWERLMDRRMSMPPRPNWDRLLGGMQLGVFEVVWGVFPWIKAIWIRKSSGRAYFHIHVCEMPDEEEQEECRSQVEMLIDAAKNFDKVSFRAGYTIRYSPRRVPRGMGYRTLMSDRFFRQIARKHAPWRPERGR
jgi:hypothetical protein